MWNTATTYSRSRGVSVGRQSAARLEGDRYQHLYSWYLILQLLQPETKVNRIWLEHADALFADDVVVYSQNPSENPTKFYQIKWHVDHRRSYSMDSIIRTKRDSISLLQKMWQSWKHLKSASPLEIWLVSNVGTTQGDPLGFLTQGRDNRLKNDLLKCRARSKLNIYRRKWQSHLNASDHEFAEFYRALRFELGSPSINSLNKLIDERMNFLGLASGDHARSISIDLVKTWIEERDNIEITLDKLNDALSHNHLLLSRKANTGIVVAVQNWSRRKFDVATDFELDWTRLFDHPTRRVPKTVTWARTLLPQLRSVEQKIRTEKSERLIRLRGDICLSTAFAVGNIFSASAGYRFEIQHRQQIWFSDVPPDEAYQIDFVLENGNPNAKDLLCVISVTGDAKPQALQYVERRNLRFQAQLSLAPIDGSHDHSIRGNVDASSFAWRVRSSLRQAVDRIVPQTTHLFYFGPASLAVLIGQKLNACGEIQFYEFQNPGYVPSCRIK